MPFSLSRSHQPKEIRRRIVVCRERLRRTRGTQRIDARATTLEAVRESSPASDARASDATQDARSLERALSMKRTERDSIVGAENSARRKKA